MTTKKTRSISSSELELEIRRVFLCKGRVSPATDLFLIWEGWVFLESSSILHLFVLNSSGQWSIYACVNVIQQ